MNIPSIDRSGPDDPMCRCALEDYWYCPGCDIEFCECVDDHKCIIHNPKDIFKCESFAICYNRMHPFDPRKTYVLCEHYPCECGWKVAK